jgi:polysaccharide export outer membrane protein
MVRIYVGSVGWAGALRAALLGLAAFLVAGLATLGAQQQTLTPAMSPAVTKGSESPAARPTAAQAAEGDYIVSPEDLLDIQIMDVQEISRTYRVSANGFLTLPLLPEPIPAAGSSLNQLSHLIAAKYREAGMLNNADVSVSLRETRLHAVMVSGEVKLPQSYPVYGPTRLLDVLMKAGGLSEEADYKVTIVRGDAGARADEAESAKLGTPNPSAGGQPFALDVHKLLAAGDEKANILLYPGDRISVPKAQMVYIMGAVQRPGGYVLGEHYQHMTVIKALAAAGDVTLYAKKSHITLLRKDAAASPDSLKRQEIPVDYKAMLKGKIADMSLLPDDILYVPESTGMKALHAGATSALQSMSYGVSGLLIYR